MDFRSRCHLLLDLYNNWPWKPIIKPKRILKRKLEVVGQRVHHWLWHVHHSSVRCHHFIFQLCFLKIKLCHQEVHPNCCWYFVFCKYHISIVYVHVFLNKRRARWGIRLCQTLRNQCGLLWFYVLDCSLLGIIIKVTMIIDLF